MEKILVVEDYTDIHNLIKNILEKNIDLILLDLMLPGLDGKEIIEKVKEIPIIVISAKISEEDKINALLNGANDYIVKSFNSQKFLARVKVQLRINNGKKVNKKISK